jgi:DNA-binding response OmpR family regulator
MKILLLEDDIALNRAIKKIIELDGHVACSYIDGKDVFDSLDEHNDLYILDINVPNINGIELLDIIYKKNKTSKVIIISSNTDIHSIQQAYKLGCIDYLKKPFHVEELRLKINQLDKQKKLLISNIKFKNSFESLTKKEKIFLNLLLDNQDSIVTYQTIEEHVYDGNLMTMDALRALVRRLRLKLVDDIIKNIIEEGYKLEHL